MHWRLIKKQQLLVFLSLECSVLFALEFFNGTACGNGAVALRLSGCVSWLFDVRLFALLLDLLLQLLCVKQ